jgi:hypothetical protein
MSKSYTRPQAHFVQKRITSYFPRIERYPKCLLSISTQLASFFREETCETYDSGYVEETPQSKQGNPDFYLGRCNTVDESPRRSLFYFSESVASEYLGTISSSCNLTSIHYPPRKFVSGPTTSCESIAR